MKTFPHGFKPFYTPIRMIKLGIFGGGYFTEATEADFEGLTPALERLARTQTNGLKPKLNRYGVKAGLHYDEWMANGWIFPEDPLGWFHWYCRFYSGRRHERDAHQVRRHQRYNERWGLRARSQAQRGYISPVIMQGLLQWSCDPEGTDRG